MKKDLENLDFKFWSWFPSGIKDPKRINYFLNQRSKLLDREIIKKFEDFNLQADFSLFAIGGYGNKEIFPSSDIDISILQINSKIKDYSNLEKFVASLWDFGLKVGHSVRTEQDIKKIVASDIKEFTSYLSLRPISANKKSLEIIHRIFEKKEKLEKATKEYAKAQKLLLKSNKKKPNKADTLNYLGFTTRKLGDFEGGEKYYLQGLAINPSHIGINEYLGELYVATGRHNLAVERLQVLESCNCKEYDQLKSVIAGEKVSKY